MGKKFFLVVLALFLVMPLLFACKDGDGSNSGTEGDGKTPFGLPDKDWGKQTVVFSTVEEGHDTYSDVEIAAYESKSSYVNDASYQRYQKLSEDYGIEVEVNFRQTGTGVDIIKTSIEAGTCDFDIIVHSALKLAEYAVQDLLYDLTDVKDLNLSNVWWDQASIKDLSVKNHVFFASGDLLVSDKGATWVCFFNKDMYEKYFPGEDSLYDCVKNGDWTLDKLYELSLVIGEQNKSLSDITGENGTFGLVTQTYDGIASMMSFNQKMISKDDNDAFVLSLDNDETKTKFIKLFEVMQDENTSLIAENEWRGQGYPTIPNNATKIFKEGRGLFQYNKLGYVQALSDTNLDFKYGVLPMPKFDKVQDNYYSPATVYWALFIALPKTSSPEKLDLVAYTLEAMGYYGKELLQPAYYDTTIKSQKMTDQGSEDMLDIVFASRIWDPAAVYDFGDSLTMYTGLLMSNSADIASSIEKNSGSIQSSLDDIMEQINALEEQQTAK